MRYQPRPTIDFKNTFNSIASVKKPLTKRAILTSLGPQIFPHATIYSKRLEDLDSMMYTNWSEEKKSALRSCYDSSTKPLEELKDSMLVALKSHGDVNLTVCPYCMLKQPSSWDHYFPQHWYPEFSVMPSNLVYVCSDCNKGKLDSQDSVDLQYIHPYFYPDSDATILHCGTTIDNGCLVIRFYCAALDTQYAKLAKIGERHIHNLELQKLYQSEAGSIVSTFIAEIRRDFSEGINSDILNGLIAKRYEMVEVQLGCNAWQAGLWKALYDFVDFPAYVNQQIKKPQRLLRGGLATPTPPPPSS